jgi:hypothetical protein
MKTFGQIRYPQLVFRLSGDPGPGYHLVIKTDQDTPPAADAGQTIDHSGGSLFVIFWII